MLFAVSLLQRWKHEGLTCLSPRTSWVMLLLLSRRPSERMWREGRALAAHSHLIQWNQPLHNFALKIELFLFDSVQLVQQQNNYRELICAWHAGSLALAKLRQNETWIQTFAWFCFATVNLRCAELSACVSGLWLSTGRVGEMLNPQWDRSGRILCFSCVTPFHPHDDGTVSLDVTWGYQHSVPRSRKWSCCVF